MIKIKIKIICLPNDLKSLNHYHDFINHQNHKIIYPKFNYMSRYTRFVASQSSLAYRIVCFQHQQFLTRK